jgi:hypothetical protein
LETVRRGGDRTVVTLLNHVAPDLMWQDAWRRAACNNQDGTIVMQAALMALSGVKRTISRSGSHVVVELNAIAKSLKPLTGGANTSCMEAEDKDDTVQIAIPLRISHSFVSGVTSMVARPDRGLTLGGGAQRQTKTKSVPSGPNVQTLGQEQETGPPKKRIRVLAKVISLPK